MIPLGKVAVGSVASTVLGVAMHFAAHSYLYLENTVVSKFESTKAGIIGGLAEDLGYSKYTPEPKLSHVELAEKEALKAGLNPSLVRALIKTESNWNPVAISKAGGLGLTQVLSSNARPRCGIEPGELLVADQNIRCGVKILAEELKASNGDTIQALKRYNGGYGVCSKTNACPETEAYYRRVLSVMATDII